MRLRKVLWALTGGVMGIVGYRIAQSWFGFEPPEPSWTGVAVCMALMILIPIPFRLFSRKASPPHA
jgi:hypothetical protein